jgi:hypothetical protein
MTDDERQRFPLGKPLNRKEPAKHTPVREQVKRGIFSVDGRLETDLPTQGPRVAPAPAPTADDSCGLRYTHRRL